MIGGFLGAGKSTAMARLGRYLSERGTTVGLITNDQANGLVDTFSLRKQGFAVEEIPGGCFCCRFQSLMDAARSLSDETRPDVFLAEPVGSCTDLVASVSYPLRRIYGERFGVAPFSVLVDPTRARRVLGLDPSRSFSRKVVYVYRKQMEEADYIVINKTDLLEADMLRELGAKILEEFPGKRLIEVSARTGDGLEEWFERLLAEEMPGGVAMEIDYDTYAEGEALLGWLNATLELRCEHDIDGNALLRDTAASLNERLRLQGAEVAHLKMTLEPGDGLGELALVSLVRSDFVPELAQSLIEPLRAGEIIVNLRAEATPELLRSAFEAELESRRRAAGVRLELEHLECFKPGRPEPTHRMRESP